MRTKRGSGLLLILLLTFLFGSGCQTFAGGASSAVYLDVFDCLIPVPAGYAFNASDSATTHAYTPRVREGRGRWGEIVVWNYDGPVPRDRYEILKSETRGVLTIEEVRAHPALRPREQRESVILITNGIHKLSLGGRAKESAETMIEACLASLR